MVGKIREYWWVVVTRHTSNQQIVPQRKVQEIQNSIHISFSSYIHINQVYFAFNDRGFSLWDHTCCSIQVPWNKLENEHTHIMIFIRIAVSEFFKHFLDRSHGFIMFMVFFDRFDDYIWFIDWQKEGKIKITVLLVKLI